MKTHIPVMTDEVIKYLAPQKNKNYIDATVGLGGHARKIIEKIRPHGKLLCIDFNKESLSEAKKNLQNYHQQSIFANNNFSSIQKVVQNTNFKGIFGILYDLGLASWQIENSGLGISFSHDEPLNMNLGIKSNRVAIKQINITADEIINKYPIKKIADILYQYGDIRNSWSVARKIEIARRKNPIKTTFDLVRAISFNPNTGNKLKKSNLRPRRVGDYPATYMVQGKFLAPIFQAFRIIVNNEFENLEDSLQQAIEIIDSGGRIVVISYHSGEDRIVKNVFRTNKGRLKILTKKPITPSQVEIGINSRARSAKLRVVEKL